jgi:lipopolysaccharide/colanic/teichoic acid biosynthesis glycosyltransferase
VTGLVVLSGYLLRSPSYYSHVVIDAPSGLTLTFLQNAMSNAESCHVLSETIVSVALAKCPDCNLKTKACVTKLERDLEELQSEAAVLIPTARLQSGTIAYFHADPQVALMTCSESQTQVEKDQSSGANFKCFPANVSRSLPIGYAVSPSYFHEVVQAMMRSVAVLCFSLALYLAVQFLAVRNPTETAVIAEQTHSEFKASNAVKRVIDVVTSIALLTVLLPVLVFFSVVLFVLEGAPIFYVSRRHISVWRSVTIVKFRTMVMDADSPKYQLRERYMRDGYLDIPLTCEVYTPIGRFLERTQLVEVFQLFNIFFHGMSLIGNRPLPRSNLTLLEKFEGWQERFDSPAGLTGLSQIVGKLNQTPTERLELECGYSAVYKRSRGNILICDIQIIWYTIRLLLFGVPISMTKARKMIGISSERD